MVVDFGRLITAMVTPLDDNLQIHWSQLEVLVDYLIEEQQSETLIVSGTTGESPTLTDGEKLQLFRKVVELAAGRCKVIAGTGSYDTAHSIHLTKLAEETGVDGILLVAPYYNKPSQEGLYQHFKAVAEATALPVMLYNVPGRSVANILPDTMLRLAQIPNVVATKEAHGDLDHITLLLAKAPEGFVVYCGDDSLTLPYLSVGAKGIVSVASHVIGKEMKEMISQYLSGQVEQAAKTHQKLFPVFKGLFHCPHPVPSPVPVKYALKLKGVDVGGVRLPLVNPTEQEAQFIKALFE
ncbi:4-hydroxy-tetrahydrodipicolinate synthase [Paenibacillus aurantius]|uniref:4-hydroxy-tetrahydrodipicolinate synthase n=1 Tax=Paenibacillus aurantius TaxID=2918900 RepID=A0AA96LKK6_9BACL|nr:4-hydroxy-tetrahydrodipicolinate synthase [Paenibacillus aurantius]WNQ13786.1 4-hydroxy-tetrahydrodipicolinate synthase [Paenibacillus aurantius]